MRPRAARRLAVGLALAASLACDEAEMADATDTDDVGETGEGTEGQIVPADPDALHAWVLGGVYREWDSWSAVMPTGGHGGARVYLNDALVDSLARGDARHPQGAAAVRELYGPDLAALTGFAVLTRVDEGEGGEAWLFFEVFDPAPDATPATAERGAPGCVGCHAEGVDFVRSTLPLP